MYELCNRIVSVRLLASFPSRFTGSLPVRGLMLPGRYYLLPVLMSVDVKEGFSEPARVKYSALYISVTNALVLGLLLFNVTLYKSLIYPKHVFKAFSRFTLSDGMWKREKNSM